MVESKGIMGMLRKEDDKKPNEFPPPPEPEFFDEPKGARKAVGVVFDLLGKNWVRVVLAVIAALTVSVVFLFWPAKQKPEVSHDSAEGSRIPITAQGMQAAIDSSVKSRPINVRSNERKRGTNETRKYDSEIAVFVEKPESPRKESPGEKRSDGKLKLGISAGTKIPAVLSDRVFSFNVAAPVTAVVAKEFLVDDETTVPKSSRFLGEVNVLKSVNRINIRFDLLIFPDGREFRVRAIALSEDGSSGIKGKVDKHTDTKVLKAIGETLLAGASMFVGARSHDPYSLEDQIRSSFAENMTSQAAQDLRSVKVDKSITVESGKNILVMLLEAI